MPSLQRQLVTLEMLVEELADELGLLLAQVKPEISLHYLALLKQYLKSCKLLAYEADTHTEQGFSEIIINQGICTHLVSKKMLFVQNKLITYAIEYYDATSKLNDIRDIDFSEQADIRFDLLNVKAIKLKAQFRTVATAMSEPDYCMLQKGACLPDFDWGWDNL
ncbi:MAG: hypothetical protein ABJK64_01655 [Paraglaciecola sp.]|uniref:hypothetical protein n=1 Tax=Paraglaciecola sp. TaxID=1920173 RepID=UPI003296B4D0